MSERKPTSELIERGIACEHLDPKSICSVCAFKLAKEDERNLAASQAVVKGLVEALTNRCPCWGGEPKNSEGHSRDDCHQKKALAEFVAAKHSTAALDAAIAEAVKREVAKAEYQVWDFLQGIAKKSPYHELVATIEVNLNRAKPHPPTQPKGKESK